MGRTRSRGRTVRGSGSGDMDGSAMRGVFATFSFFRDHVLLPSLPAASCHAALAGGPACGCLVDGHPERPSHVAPPGLHADSTPPQATRLPHRPCAARWSVLSTAVQQAIGHTAPRSRCAAQSRVPALDALAPADPVSRLRCADRPALTRDRAAGADCGRTTVERKGPEKKIFHVVGHVCLTYTHNPEL